MDHSVLQQLPDVRSSRTDHLLEELLHLYCLLPDQILELNTTAALQTNAFPPNCVPIRHSSTNLCDEVVDVLEHELPSLVPGASLREGDSGNLPR